uniref:Uncharacterized protein n=1 Tax=Oryza sativa subsp. japonica TaxID=39947 RepID=Q6F341_ORYSJ|nr:hypothetical protein [Oryza sativa Japonica Group]AAU90158.1 hypothetical protein [Oryza sativa Japonica Group]
MLQLDSDDVASVIFSLAKEADSGGLGIADFMTTMTDEDVNSWRFDKAGEMLMNIEIAALSSLTLRVAGNPSIFVIHSINAMQKEATNHTVHQIDITTTKLAL